MMVEYRIVWSGKYGQGEKITASAIMADAWVDEARDKGADAIKVIRDRVVIEIKDLPKLIEQETARAQESRNAQES